MIKIHNEFTGGNILVKEIADNTVILENELRDTGENWFYWAFCVEGAGGQTLTFKMQPKRLGYFGPAVSHDLENWNWLGEGGDDSFTYHFAKDENKVYFAHHMLYHPNRFQALCGELGLEISEHCISRRGRSVPCLHIGNGDTSFVFTARHHACESPGSYVLEGIIRELAASPIPNSRILIVPFVDYDGVVDGDQGKSRLPHDHNRDYIDEPIYPEIRATCRHMDTYGCNYGFDLHAPGHRGGVNDTIFVVRNLEEKIACFDRFSDIFQSEVGEHSMKYVKENDYQPKTGWNQPSSNFGFTTNTRPECKLAFSLENTYFGSENDKISAKKLIELGKCFARSVKKYVSED